MPLPPPEKASGQQTACLLPLLRIRLKEEKEGEMAGRRREEPGLWRAGSRSKTREVRRKRKPPLLPQIDSPAMPASPAVL